MFTQLLEKSRETARQIIPETAGNSLILIIILLIFLLVAAAGLFGLVYSSNLAPLIIGALVVAPLALIIILNRPAWALYLAIFVVYIPLGILPFEVQSYLNRGTVILAFVVWLFETLSKKKKIRLPAASWFLLAFILWALVTLIWAEHDADSMTAIQTYALRFILFLLVGANIIHSEKRLHGLLYTLAISGALMMATSLVVLLIDGYVPGTRFKVLAMNENEVGFVFLLTLMGVMWWGSQPSKSYGFIKKATTFAFMVISFGLIAITGSRGGLISYAMTMLSFALWKPTRKWPMFVLVVIFLFIPVTPFIFTTLTERFTFSGIRGDTLLGGREGLWQAAYLLIKDNLWTGVGIGNSVYAIRPYFSHPSVDSVIVPIQIWSLETVPIHNPVLTILADTGIFGLFLYLGILMSAGLTFIVSWLKKYSQEMNLYHAIVGSVFFGYLFSWIKGGGVESGQSMFLMTLLLVAPSLIIKRKIGAEKGNRESGIQPLDPLLNEKRTRRD